MAINVTARHMEASEGLVSFARSRGEHITEEFPNVESVQLILDESKHGHSVHIVVQGRKHIHLEAEEEAENMHMAMDAAVEKITRQLRRIHDKARDHKVTMKHAEETRDRLEGVTE
jgi:ribosomal subunit interface protein